MGIILILHCRYYEGGVSSVYFWDLDDGFAGVVLLKKSNAAPTFLALLGRIRVNFLKGQADGCSNAQEQ